MNIAMSVSMRHRMLAVLLLLLAILQQPITKAADWDIDQLMQSLSKAKPGRATFTEKKYMAMLDRPLESSGELLYTAPDRLEKRTIKPKPESVLVDGNELVVEHGKKKHTLQLQDYPELAGFIDSVRGTLAGDRKVLERSYKLTLEGGIEHWVLNLFPKDPKIATMVQQIRILGSLDKVSSIDVIQADGDHALMTIDRAESRSVPQ